MKKEGFGSHLLSLLLVFALVLSSFSLTQVPVYANGETGSIEGLNDFGEIIAYEELAPDIAAQTVPLGTDESSLNLPEMLAAKVLLPLDVASDVYGSASAVNLSVPVIWTSSPAYDGNSSGKYTFTAVAEGYTVSTEPPVVTITVGKETSSASTGVIKGFAELPEDIRWQNTMSPVFPENLEGTIEGHKIRIPVTWEADHYYDGEQPQRGLYVFTAVLDQGYSVADGVELPRLTVFIPQTAGLMMARLAGSGTAGSPLEITTAAQLAEIATLVNARPNGLELFLFNDENATVSLKLMKDIDLSAYSKGDGWTPIGKDFTTPFKGIFDGNNNTISGLYINCNAELQGLFGHIAGGTVRNLGVTNVRVTGYRNVGSLAGCVAEGSVENCYSSGSVTGTGTGHNEGWRVGGLVGYVSISTVANCYSTCSVTGVSDVGGIAGNVYYSTIQNCYSTGSVMGQNNIGGVAGNIWHYVTLENCAALNAFISGNDYVGRVSWLDPTCNLSNNYALSGIPGTWKYKGLENTDGADVTKENLSDSSIWTTGDNWNGSPWDSSIWYFEDNRLPVLKGFAGQDGTFPPHISGSHFAGSGTSDTDPYLIKTAADLAKLAELVNEGTSPYADAGKYYRLENDLDLSAYSSGEGWTPIGKYISTTDNSKAFKGHFDGNNKVITGLCINRTSDYQGLFGYINGGTVKNVGLTNVSIIGNNNVGGVAGYVNNGSVSACYSIGSVIGNIHVGGLAGYINAGTVQNCYSCGSISGSGDYVGGVVGYVATTSSSLQYCYSSSDVSGDEYVGGVAGSMQQSTVKNCVALNSSISSTSGQKVWRIAASGSPLNNYAFSSIPGTWRNIGLNNIDGADVTKEDLSDSSIWTTEGNWNGSQWDSNVWVIADNKLPVLKDLAGQDGTFPPHISGSVFTGSGTSDSPYLIKTAADLAKLAELVNEGTAPYADAGKYYRLENDLDLSAYSSGEGWTPIGKYISTTDNSKAFKGHFDGNNKVITGLCINRTSDYQGLFGYINGGTVKNVGLTNVSIIAQDYVGGVAGYVKNGSVSACYSIGSVIGNIHVGGLAGYINAGTVQNCYSCGSISGSGDYVGGVVGYVAATSSSLQYCYSSSDVSGDEYVGGVAGFNWGGSIVENCAALNSSVSGLEYVGRVIGSEGADSSFNNNYAFSGMPGTWNKKGLSAVDGADVTLQDMYDPNFWTTAANWYDKPWNSNVWIFSDHKLPVLKGIAGQSGDGGLILMPRDIQYATVTLDQTSFTYNGSLQRPNLTVTFAGETLAENRDYTVTITSVDGNGQSAGTKAGEVTLTITGKGNFSGTKSVNYTIEEGPGGGNTGGSSSGGGTSPALVTQINSGSSTTNSNLQRLVSEGKTLTVVGENGARLVFYPDALNGIIRQASGNIRVEIKDVSSQHQERLPGKIVFSLTVSSSSGTISDFGGRVTVSLPYELKEGESAEDVTVWHLADDGTMIEIPCTYDTATKLVTFTVTHFSLYVVGVAEAQPWVNPFSDVAVSDWFYSAVEYVNRNGLFFGTADDTFSPNSPMTRAMLWTVLGRLDGQNLSGSDVFDAARSWAVGLGITDGTNPDDSITREQMIAIMWRYAGSPRSKGDLSTFSDADNVADYANEAMAWAVQKGIVAGSNGALMPKDNTTRAQVAAVMQKFVEKGK